MDRRHLIFLIGINAFVSLIIALLVAWLVELRRPDPEQLAAVLPVSPPGYSASSPDLAVPSEQLPANVPTPPAIVQSEQRPSGEVYVVQSGDSLSSIATRYNTSIDAILEANQLDNPDFVFVGQRLIVPLNVSSSSGASGGAANNQTDGSTASTAPAESPASDSLATLRITQIEGRGDLENEAIQIVNESDLALNLQGWTLGYEGGPIYTFGNFPIFPGGSVKLFSRSGTDTTVNLFWGQADAVWQPNVEARLVNSQGQLVHQYRIPE